ncbi:MAG: hypothetical protein AAFY41_09165 [Bacteroidota bacterium]
MGIKQEKTGYRTFLVIFILAIFFIGNGIERHQTLPLILAFVSAFLGYIFLLQKKEATHTLFYVGVITRLLLFFSLPSLSDDLYRFIWDGTLIKNGIHPFEELPVFYLDNPIPGLSSELFDKLNSPNYFTIYPPLNQFIFWIATAIGNSSWLIAANVIRTILFAADIGSFFLLKAILRQCEKPTYLAYWYFLNPLVILELVGNLHFEGLVVFFILLGIYHFHKGKSFVSAVGFGIAIGTKLLPLIYLPYLFLRGLVNKKWWISILAGVIAILSLVPMLNQSFLNGMQESLDLYFRSFEFNASLYFIARAIGNWIYGYNNIALIGPLLSILSFVSILTISFVSFKKKWSLAKTLLFILTAYLFFTTTVHPWYIIPLIAFGVIANYWYPMFWSFLIFITYLGYTKEGFELPIFVVIIEYIGLVSVIYYELKFKFQENE